MHHDSVMHHKERRKTERLRPTTGNHVTILAGEKILSARIINISKGGVALVYASGQCLYGGDEVNLDVMVSGTTSHEITSLRCKTVYDLLALSEGGSYSGVTTRQCGLEFTANGDHKEDQLAQILTGF